jgi:hypothetical protein
MARAGGKNKPIKTNYAGSKQLPEKAGEETTLQRAMPFIIWAVIVVATLGYFISIRSTWTPLVVVGALISWKLVLANNRRKSKTRN